MIIKKVMVGLVLIACTIFAPAKDCSDCGRKVGDMAKRQPLKAYPLKTCLVSGKTLDKKKIAYSYRGQQIEFCSKKCKQVFTKSAETYLSKLEEKKAAEMAQK